MILKFRDTISSPEAVFLYYLLAGDFVLSVLFFLFKHNYYGQYRIFLSDIFFAMKVAYISSFLTLAVKTRSTSKSSFFNKNAGKIVCFYGVSCLIFYIFCGMTSVVSLATTHLLFATFY